MRPFNPYGNNRTNTHQHLVQNPDARDEAPRSFLAQEVPPNTNHPSVQDPAARTIGPPATVQATTLTATQSNRLAELTDICVGRRRLVGRDRQFGCNVGIGAQHDPSVEPSPQDEVGSDNDDVDEEAILSGMIGLTKRHKPC